MADISLAALLLIFLPFLMSLAGQGGMAKMLTLVTSILGLLLSVRAYGAVLPWIAGMAIALTSVRERFRRRRTA